MRNRKTSFVVSLVMSAVMLFGSAVMVPAAADTKLEDGTYSALFETDGSMFHANEVCEDRGILTVKDGEMTLHVTLVSKKIINLFCGSADEAQEEGAVLLEPTMDEVTYDDGMTDEVYGFDIPVPALDEPFAVALIGTKNKWYDHEVTVSDPQPLSEEELEELSQKVKIGTAEEEA